MGIAVWRIVINPKHMSLFGGMSVFAEKNVCLPTQLGACSHPTGRPTVPYRCTIDVRASWARQAPSGFTAAGGSLQLTFIGGSRFGRPALSAQAGAIVNIRILTQGRIIAEECASNRFFEHSDERRWHRCNLFAIDVA